MYGFEASHGIRFGRDRFLEHTVHPGLHLRQDVPCPNPLHPLQPGAVQGKLGPDEYLDDCTQQRDVHQTVEAAYAHHLNLRGTEGAHCADVTRVGLENVMTYKETN